MKQLAKLAQAIVHGPKLIILDEPTNGLDPPTRSRMISLIRQIRDGGRARILLSSHLLRDVEECCDEILVLKDGYIAANCNLEEERKANRKFIELETRGGNRAGLCRSDRRSRMRVRSVGRATRKSDHAGDGGDQRSVSPRARTRGADQAAQFQTRFARRYFPEGDGERKRTRRTGGQAMAVYEHLYGAYEGESHSAWSRFLVIPRYALREVFKSKLFTTIFILCFIYPLVATILVYLHHNANALALLQINVRELLPIDASFFRTFSRSRARSLLS